MGETVARPTFGPRGPKLGPYFKESLAQGYSQRKPSGNNRVGGYIPQHFGIDGTRLFGQKKRALFRRGFFPNPFTGSKGFYTILCMGIFLMWGKILCGRHNLVFGA